MGVREAGRGALSLWETGFALEGTGVGGWPVNGARPLTRMFELTLEIHLSPLGEVDEHDGSGLDRRIWSLIARTVLCHCEVRSDAAIQKAKGQKAGLLRRKGSSQ